MKSISRQRGHAAILFAICIPALFGLFTLASDGARALQAKARLGDALEAAVLSIAAHNDDNTDTSDDGNSGSSINIGIAKGYIEQYLSDMDDVSRIVVSKLSCGKNDDCDVNDPNTMRFLEYQLEASTEFLSWFPGNDVTAGFGERLHVAGRSHARKYQSEAVDVVLVVDYSGSMDDSRSGGSEKIKELHEVVKLVTDELQTFNRYEMSNNKVALTGFNFYTHRSENCYVDQLLWDSNKNEPDYDKTITKIFEEKTRCIDGNNDDESYFYDLSLTDEFDDFNFELNAFQAAHGTASYQGIIRAAQMAMEGTNPRRIIIILSDGDDWREHKTYSQELVDKGMCERIREELANETASGKPVHAKIAVVGFDYDLDKNTALVDCAGEENVFKAENPEDILDKILELITEEIGHLH
ncbi:MAG: pilus assembly protein [Pseudomonadales bacterium]|nr:pilus assembly protein [Pseudomonadales bacterium]